MALTRKKSNSILRILSGMLIVITLLVSLTVASFMLTKNQDIRQRASVTPDYFRGLNLMGPFQSPWGGANVFANTNQLDYYKNKGLTTIRQPILWEALQPTKFGALDSTYLSQMDTFVNNLKARGMRVHFTLINQGVYPARSTNVIDGNDLSDLWKKLAEHYKNEPTVWAYDVMNEPYNDNNWNTHGQQVINTIRTIDSSKPIIISPQVEWPEGYNNFAGFNDPSSNLIYQAHVYFDKDRSGQYSAGGYDQEGAYPEIGVDRSKPFVDWCIAHNAKCYMGEYGIPGGWVSGTPTTTYGEAVNDPRWNVVLDKLLTYLDQNNISGTYWNAGPYGDRNSVEPNNLGQDRPQMAILTSHLGVQSVTPTVISTTVPTATVAPSDIVAPSVSITSPINGSVIKVKSTINIQATASDNVGISKVEFFINGSLLCSVAKAPYVCVWKLPASKNKNYNISAIAADTTGNNSSTSITVTAR